MLSNLRLHTRKGSRKTPGRVGEYGPSLGAAGKIPEYRHPTNRYRLYKQADLEKINAQVEHSITPAATTKHPNRPR